MIYVCADDYGVSKEANQRIEKCFKEGVLSKVSVLPNGEIDNFKEKLAKDGGILSLHLNLVEGKPLTEGLKVLTDKNGCFKYSFAGLYNLCISPKKKKVEEELYREIKNQIVFWKNQMGKDEIYIDSHQHAHMIPMVFKTLMRVIREEEINVAYLRTSDEPISIYLATVSLYPTYNIMGLVKQTVLKILAMVNKKELKKANIRTAYFMGLMLSVRLDESRVKKLLVHYERLAKKKGMDIEIAFHPGYMEKGEELCFGRESFKNFYLSHYRRLEYDAVMNFKI